MEGNSLIVGLGNPGAKYVSTRHNFGFMVIDAITALGAERKSMRLEKIDESGDYELFKAKFAGAFRFFAKPLTFMNLSGKAVARICGRHDIPVGNVVVLHDELDLHLGRMKMKRGGGNNGHRGLESITERLSDNNYLRLRLGIGRPVKEFQDISDWVLEDFSKDDNAIVRGVIKASIKGIDLLCRRNLSIAQQFINKYSPE